MINTISKNDKILILNNLKDTLKQYIQFPFAVRSICQYVSVKLKTDGVDMIKEKQVDCAQSVLTRHFKSWEHYSGVFCYPIPHKTKSARSAFYSVFMLNVFSNYGRMRYKLVLHVINCIEEELREMNDGQH